MTLSRKRLERLVKHRERLEHLQEERLAEAQQQHQRRERALLETESNRDGLYAAGAPASGTVDPSEWHAAGAYLVRLKREIGARQAALAHSAETVEGERRELMERRRDVKAIEALQSHQAEQERIRRARTESKRIDELASHRWLQQQP